MVVVEEPEVHLAPEGTVGALPDDVGEMGVALVGRVDEGVGEGVLGVGREVEAVGTGVGDGALDLVVAPAGDDAVGKTGVKQGIENMVVVNISDAQGDAFATCPAVEAGEGAMDEVVVSAEQIDAMAAGIAEEAVDGGTDGERGLQPVLADIVDDGIGEHEGGGGVKGVGSLEAQTEGGAVDVAVKEDIVLAGRAEDDAAPLGGDAVVGEVAEHVVEPVTPEEDGGVGGAEGMEGAIDTQVGRLREKHP